MSKKKLLDKIPQEIKLSEFIEHVHDSIEGTVWELKLKIGENQCYGNYDEIGIRIIDKLNGDIEVGFISLGIKNEKELEIVYIFLEENNCGECKELYMMWLCQIKIIKDLDIIDNQKEAILPLFNNFIHSGIDAEIFDYIAFNKDKKEISLNNLDRNSLIKFLELYDDFRLKCINVMGTKEFDDFNFTMNITDLGIYINNLEDWFEEFIPNIFDIFYNEISLHFILEDNEHYEEYIYDKEI